MNPSITSPEFKQLLKEVLTETLHEQRELFHELFSEASEDFGLTEAIEVGLETGRISRSEVFDVLGDRP